MEIKRITFEVPKNDHTLIKKLAAELNMSIGQLMMQAFVIYLQTHVKQSNTRN